MNFGVPVAVPLSGPAGLRFLQRTEERQLELVANSPRVLRELAHFDAHIGEATTAEALVNDPILLRVALVAFGLEDQLPNKAFLLKVLEEGTDSDDSFANRLADSRFREFAKAFGYGNLAGPAVHFHFFRDQVKSDFLRQSFEIAVGEQDDNLRLALNFMRKIGEIAESRSVARSGWFEVLGQVPLRRVASLALGLPAAASGLSLDRQRDILETKALSLLGKKDPSVFRDPEAVEKTVRLFLLRAQIAEFGTGLVPGAAALTLLQSAGLGSAASAGLVLSFT